MIVWNEKINSRDEVKAIKFDDGDTVELDFNTRLIPNSLLNQVKKLEGQKFNELGWKLEVLSVIIADAGNLTSMKFFIARI